MPMPELSERGCSASPLLSGGCSQGLPFGLQVDLLDLYWCTGPNARVPGVVTCPSAAVLYPLPLPRAAIRGTPLQQALARWTMSAHDGDQPRQENLETTGA